MSANPKQPQAGDVFFYIIGGEYEDMSFERLVTSTSTIEGLSKTMTARKPRGQS